MAVHPNTSSHIGTVSTAPQLLLPAPRATQQPHLDIPNITGHRPEPQEMSSRVNTGLSESYLVVSGGTGCNAICTAFARASYVLPISDDGGSSSEIIRVLGGPSIGMYRTFHPLSATDWSAHVPGDIRSRLVRLIPPVPPGTPLDALRTLLAHRLPSGHDAERAAREEWRSIVEGRSSMWAGIPEDRKETIRGTHQPVSASPCSCYIELSQVFWYISRERSYGVPTRTFRS